MVPLRLLAPISALALAVSACGAIDERDLGAEEPTGTVTSQATTTTTGITSTLAPNPSLAPTTTGSSTLTSEAPSDPNQSEAILIANEQGVFQIDADLVATRLITGPVIYAIDDTQGGLLFQTERGRLWDDQAAWDATIIWWIPRGEDAPRELLVPTPGSGHRLSLHDAFETPEGFGVLYTRHEGSGHDELGNVDAIVDRLRRYDYPSDSVTQLRSTGAWEQGYAPTCSDGNLISGVLYGHVDSACLLLDIEGESIGLLPTTGDDMSREQNIGGCAITLDAHALAFTRTLEEPPLTEIHLLEISGEEPEELMIPIEERWGMTDLDVSGHRVLLNRGWEGDADHPALIIDFSRPEGDPVELPLAGLARFVTNPIDIQVGGKTAD